MNSIFLLILLFSLTNCLKSNDFCELSIEKYNECNGSYLALNVPQLFVLNTKLYALNTKKSLKTFSYIQLKMKQSNI